MSQIMSNNLRKYAVAVVLLAAFWVVGTVESSAQQITAKNGANPEQLIAQKLGVTAYTLGTANPAEVVSTLNAAAEQLKPNLTDATLATKFKYTYYVLVVNDVQNMSIAPEIALLNNLGRAARQVGNVTESMMKTTYNQTISLLGL